MKKLIMWVLALVVVIGLIALMAVTYDGNRSVREDVSLAREPLKFQTYCLKGKTVLLISHRQGGPGSYIYDVDAEGKPVACK